MEKPVLKRGHPFRIVAQHRSELLVRNTSMISAHEDVAADIFALLEGFGLQQVRRYFHQRYWESETAEAEFADRVELGLKLENVAAHSWHVADAALLLLDHFQWLNREQCVTLAILHDKLEMFTGDANPVGKNGSGSKTHAFDESARVTKTAVERHALARYVRRLRPKLAERQLQLFSEMISGASQEALFIKAVDKLQALAFVHVKKRGDINNSHLKFTLKYSRKCCEYFPPLRRHYEFLRDIFVAQVASIRGCSVAELERELFPQFEFQFGACELPNE